MPRACGRGRAGGPPRRGDHHEHGQAEAKWPVLGGKAADRPEQVVDQHHHRNRHRRRGQEPRSAGQPQHAVAGRVDQGEQDAVEQAERAVADRGQLEPGGEEIDGSHAVLGGGVDQHGAAVQHDVGRAEDEVMVELRDGYSQGLQEPAGRIGGVEDHEIRDRQQDQGDHRQVDDDANAPRRPGEAPGPRRAKATHAAAAATSPSPSATGLIDSTTVKASSAHNRKAPVIAQRSVARGASAAARPRAAAGARATGRLPRRPTTSTPPRASRRALRPAPGARPRGPR